MICRVDSLSREFIRGTESFMAVENVGFTVDEGKLVVITGHSGSGKSTLFHMLSGMIKPTSGSIEILGKNIVKLSNAEMTVFRGTKLAYVMQGVNLLSNFTVWENILIPASMNGQAINEEHVDRLLDSFGLLELKNEYPGNLSGGEKRRVSIVRAFALNPQLVILDEPTSSLDPDNSKIIMEFLRKKANEGTTIIMSTHDVEYVEYADIELKMNAGRLRQ